MADSIDSLQKQLDKLKRILRAQESGIPGRLTVLVKGRAATSPEGVKRAVLARLADYGLDDELQAEEAGCVITVVSLPWLTEREVGHPELDALSADVADSIHKKSDQNIGLIV